MCLNVLRCSKGNPESRFCANRHPSLRRTCNFEGTDTRSGI